MLEFEKPIFELQSKIKELETFGSDKNIMLDPEIKKLQQKLEKMKEEIYQHLTPWQRVQIARHPDRPYALDYIRMMMDDFVEIHGDRMFADDLALIGGMARLDGIKVAALGHQKGRDNKENVRRNFGCAHPEGYRKAMRIMEMAEKFRLPVVVLIDAPGAYPGIGAEERVQAQAIASNLKDMALLRTPIIATIIGEGGSGGALALAVANRVLVLEYGTYSVISPEGCASILWKDGTKADLAASRLKMTAPDLLHLRVVDGVVDEPPGGAHQDHDLAAKLVSAALEQTLRELLGMTPDELADHRYKRFRTLGAFIA